MADALSAATEDPPASSGFIGAMGLEMWSTPAGTRGHAEITPEMLVPGTSRPRLGVLVTLADVVGGSPSHGPLNPTVDLRLRLLAEPPSSGFVELVCHILKSGRRMFVAELFLTARGEATPFARSSVTFLNERIPGSSSGFGPRPRPVLTTTFDEMVAARFVDERTVAVDPSPALDNANSRTLLGGVQAYQAELAAEWVLAPHGDYRVTDLDIRYLNRMKVGPLVARPEIISRTDVDADVRVPLTDAGDGDRIIAMVMTTCRPVAPPA